MYGVPSGYQTGNDSFVLFVFLFIFLSFFHLCVFVYLQNTTIGCFPYSILTYVLEIPVLTTLLTAELENIDLFHL